MRWKTWLNVDHNWSHICLCRVGGAVTNQIFSCDQAALQMVRLSVRPSVRLSHLIHYVPIIVSSWNFQKLLPITKVMSMQKVKVRGQRSRSQRAKPRFRTVTPVWNHRCLWNVAQSLKYSIGEMPYCLSRSYVKFQGNTGQKSLIVTQIGRFRTVIPVWIHRCLWNVTQSLK